MKWFYLTVVLGVTPNLPIILHKLYTVLRVLLYSLLGYLNPSAPKNSSLISRGLTNLNMTLELPALSLVPLARLPPNDCWPISAAVVLQSVKWHD